MPSSLATHSEERTGEMQSKAILHEVGAHDGVLKDVVAVVQSGQ